MGLRVRSLGQEVLRRLECSLKRQQLKPFETFAEMIVRHSDGIAAFCKPENKVPLGFVEGPNNKIRVIQQGPTGYETKNLFGSKC